MKTIVNALREIWGLFVEDASYTAAMAAWLLFAALVLPRLLAPGWPGPLLFAGLAAILLENVARSARRP